MCFGDPELGNAEASGKQSGWTQESQSERQATFAEFN